jgi:hypothetical protein
MKQSMCYYDTTALDDTIPPESLSMYRNYSCSLCSNFLPCWKLGIKLYASVHSFKGVLDYDMYLKAALDVCSLSYR